MPRSRAHRRASSAHDLVPARDLVVATVAHDLRNPLNAVQTVLDFTLENLLPNDESHQVVRRHLGIARNAAMQMNQLVAELLEGTTMDRGRLALRLAACDPHELARTAFDALEATASGRGITLSLDLAASLPALLADRDRLARVFSNLGANAIRFTPPDGHITIAASRADDAVRFTVSDTGIGISAQDLPHVFDRFWRADRNASGGFGLGLAIAKCIVDAHGGTMTVESNPGTGSSFSFTIPLASQLEAAVA
jgi:signal transduction histidine kinase